MDPLPTHNRGQNYETPVHDYRVINAPAPKRANRTYQYTTETSSSPCTRGGQGHWCLYNFLRLSLSHTPYPIHHSLHVSSCPDLPFSADFVTRVCKLSCLGFVLDFQDCCQVNFSLLVFCFYCLLILYWVCGDQSIWVTGFLSNELFSDERPFCFFLQCLPILSLASRFWRLMNSRFLISAKSSLSLSVLRWTLFFLFHIYFYMVRFSP